jgi:hypothetical protein
MTDKAHFRRLQLALNHEVIQRKNIVTQRNLKAYYSDAKDEQEAP